MKYLFPINLMKLKIANTDFKIFNTDFAFDFNLTFS